MNHDGTLIYSKPQNQSPDEELKQDFILWELSQTCCGEFWVSFSPPKKGAQFATVPPHK